MKLEDDSTEHDTMGRSDSSMSEHSPDISVMVMRVLLGGLLLFMTRILILDRGTGIQLGITFGPALFPIAVAVIVIMNMNMLQNVQNSRHKPRCMKRYS